MKVQLENLINRLKTSKKRTLLNNKVTKSETLKNLYKDRRKFYEEADFIINKDKDKTQLLEKIKLKLNSYE